VPTSFGIRGGTALERTRLAWAIAHRIDPEPYWLQIEDPSDGHDDSDGPLLSSIPSDHLFHLNSADLTPQPERGGMATWIVRDDIAADGRLERLANLMRLPVVPHRLLIDGDVYSSTRALVIANPDQAQPHYPSEEGGLRPFIQAVNEFAGTVIFTISMRPRPNERDVGYAFQLERSVLTGHPIIEVRCRQGAPTGAPGLFTVGSGGEQSALIKDIHGV